MIVDMWESFTWAIRTCVVQVWEVVRDLWYEHPTLVAGVVITIIFALVVTFRPVR